MYFEDLSEYIYRTNEPLQAIQNVGWLDGEHTFETGPADAQLRDALLFLCEHRVARTRGFHRCELCSSRPAGPLVFANGDTELQLGSAEIRAINASGQTFSAPDLIVHYVMDHGYRPPQRFIDAAVWSMAHPAEFSEFVRAHYPQTKDRSARKSRGQPRRHGAKPS